MPAGYLAADSITFKLMQVDGELTMFLRTDGGWQKADEPTLTRTRLCRKCIRPSRRRASFSRNNSISEKPGHLHPFG